MKQWLAPAHLALTLGIIVWNVLLAGRISRLRQASKPFAIVTGLAGLLLIPASIVAIATTTLITGRAITAIDFLWPLTILLFAIQSVYAVSRRLVNPLWGYPIAFYNVLLAIASMSRLFAAHGVDLPEPFLVLMAAQANALALTTSETALTSPLFLHVPIISPAFPAVSRLTAGVRMAMATIAMAWFGIIVAEIPRADVALESYNAHASDRIMERPNGFSVGLKILPDVEKAPSAASVRTDVETVDRVNASVVSVVFVPGASIQAIDSVARAIDLLGRDSMLVIATLGYDGKVLPELRRDSLDVEKRIATLRRVLTRLRPDIVLPAQDPYGIGARMLGRLPVTTWQNYHTRAAAVVKEVRPRTLVGMAASTFDARDSTLYAWATSEGSPIDVVGFSFYPTRLGARTMDAGFRAADRWLRAHPPTKPQWVFGAGGYPLAHGEIAQDLGIVAALSWATSHPQVRGLIVTEASDYGQAMGIRAPYGRFRKATATLDNAIRALRESFRPVPVVQPAQR